MERKRTASVRRVAAATAVLLSAVAVLAVVAFAAMPAAEAEGGDASVTSVATYEELKNALGAGGNIKINNDIDVKPALVVSGSAVIDLNGNTLTGDGCTVFDVTGTLTLKGNGTITRNDSSNVDVITVASNGADSSKGGLNIEGSVTIGSGHAIKLDLDVTDRSGVPESRFGSFEEMGFGKPPCGRLTTWTERLLSTSEASRSSF